MCRTAMQVVSFILPFTLRIELVTMNCRGREELPKFRLYGYEAHLGAVNNSLQFTPPVYNKNAVGDYDIDFRVKDDHQASN